MKKILFAALLTLVMTTSCNDDNIHQSTSKLQPYEIAATWADMTLVTIKASPPNSPTYASRSLGYIGLTMYESVVGGSDLNKSLVNQLNGLSSLPIPEPGKKYNWVLSLNAGQALILKSLYSNMSDKTASLIDSTALAIYNNEIISVDKETADRSVQFGTDVANAILEWSKTDGGYQGNLHNFDPTYVFPKGPGYWTPPTDGQSASLFPLHPYWGANRTFLELNATLPVPEILPYSTDPASDYYKQFLEVYNVNKSLTQEEKEIAAWWGDDPTQTASPPGHSYNLATIAIKSTQPDMIIAVEAYAKVGMAVCDAFINCWKCKYVYHAERPVPYIQAFIDADYLKFWPEPPFPAFSSGHATQSAAAATVLASVFGDNFKITDNTYDKRAKDVIRNVEFKTRTFSTIWATAEECAHSRLLGGIHTSQDNAQGLIQGRTIGENIVALSWKK